MSQSDIRRSVDRERVSPLNVQMQPFDVGHAQGFISSKAVEHSGVCEHIAWWLVSTIPDKIMHPELAKNLKQFGVLSDTRFWLSRQSSHQSSHGKIR